MAIHPGVKTIRTPRTIAIEKGTKSEGFAGQIDYCAQCGQPKGAGHTHYVEQKTGPVPSYVDFQQKPFK